MNEVQAMTEGDTVRVVLTTLPRPPRGAAPTLLIGGWPRILRDGKNVASDAPTVEGTISRNAEARHPRTAIGFSRDSTTLYILAVDGRSTQSVGVTLVELADADAPCRRVAGDELRRRRLDDHGRRWRC